MLLSPSPSLDLKSFGFTPDKGPLTPAPRTRPHLARALLICVCDVCVHKHASARACSTTHAHTQHIHAHTHTHTHTGKLSASKSLAQARATLSPVNIYTPSVSDAAGSKGGRRQVRGGLGSGGKGEGGGGGTLSITEPGVYAAISEKEMEVMTVFEERFGTLRHFETFSHERMGADEEPRMDQAGLLLMLTQHKLLPAIITRNEACALYKAVTRGSPLHQRHGMLFADFRECIRRVGAWKGFKLWGLSKADLAAIHDANSPTVWSGAETERTATLSSICKEQVLPSPASGRGTMRRSASPASTSPSRKLRSKHIDEIPEAVMAHIAKITGELLEANQQRDAVVRELKLVKELAAASQIAAKHNAASSGSGGMSEFVGMSNSPHTQEAKQRLEEELRLATIHAHELAERNKVCVRVCVRFIMCT